MLKTERTRYEMFLRVRDFGQAHTDLFPESSIGGQAFAAVTNAVTTIEASASEKVAALTHARREKSRTRAALYALMRAMSRTARGLALDQEGLAHRFRLPKRRSDVMLTTTARTFLDDVAGLEGEFVRMGLPPDFMADMRRLLDALETASHTQRLGRRNRAGAQAALGTAIAQGFRAIRKLDAVVVNTASSDARLLAAWQSARHLSGVRTGAVATSPPADATMPEQEVLKAAS